MWKDDTELLDISFWLIFPRKCNSGKLSVPCEFIDLVFAWQTSDISTADLVQERKTAVPSTYMQVDWLILKLSEQIQNTTTGCNPEDKLNEELFIETSSV